MNAFDDLLNGASISHFIACLGLVIALGMALGRIKIFGVSLLATFVLIVGLAVSHFGMCFPEYLYEGIDGTKHFINPAYTHFVQEFGLVIFLYAVGLQSGKSFFHALKNGGIVLNLLALSVVALDVVVALVIHYCSGLDMGTVVGILSGAVTNTPGLGAAQSVYQGMGNDPNLLASAYAAAYPLGVLGIIFTIIMIRVVFKVDIDEENRLLRLREEEESKKTANNSNATSAGSKIPPIIPIFLGLAFGVVLGNIPVMIPGIPQPLKLGIAGGSLIVAILMSAFGEKIHMPTNLSAGAISFLRELGICLFLACVGLKAGETFVETIVNGGLLWVFLGAIITIVPLIIVSVVGYAICKVDYFSLAGTLAGSMTDPPALAYSCGAFKNEKPSVSYAAVNPLSMFLRIMTAQLLILFFV